MLTVVIDTNILVSALHGHNSKPALVVSLVLNQSVKFCLSKDILDEYEGVLGRDKFNYLDPKKIKRLLGDLKKLAPLVKPKKKFEVIEDDPSDNKYLECAVKGKADYIVSGDQHLKKLKTFQGIKIVDPGTFLIVYFEGS